VRRGRPETLRRVAEQRRREASAPRLTAEVPDLRKLRLEIQERCSSPSLPGPRHARIVVVERAPALFVLPCLDPRCEEGGHDLTAPILAALRGKQRRFAGQDACGGRVGSSGCARVLDYVAVATYQTAPTALVACTGSGD